ncbi:hypothetical protein PVAND_002780 [Polypedilum vanderplanki]|uniref:DUF1279 domain-containing protein n=1 Tax=Polypedilum vanderplanki TaxID=319348 RepID=A0A9J6BST6_POLVA|nr:hypothetical protein PVAND_002780 [Polypedilum vanderplanki]
MLLNSRFLLQRSNHLYSLGYGQCGGVLFRNFAIVTKQDHLLYFHQKRFKCKDHVKTITGLLLENQYAHNKNTFYQQTNLLHISRNNFLTQKVKNNTTTVKTQNDEEKPLGLVAKFKKMTKEYWYVLVPVHCITSCFWFGGFYYASVSGVDIVGFLEQWNVSEKIINPLRNSQLGHIAVAYLLYKIATPARYTVTLGGTTFAINFLSQRGYIKPMPSKDKLVQMYKDKKDDFQQKVADTKSQLHGKLKKD